MRQTRIRAVVMRGGTSRGLIFHQADLPPAGPARDAVLLAAMGSPDPNGRQLDGMGGGISSLSKICIVGPSTHPGAEVDYTFGQVGVDVPMVDYGGNCGNMSSAIGPFAVEEGLVPRPEDGEAMVRIHNTNTGKVIAARFPVQGGVPRLQGDFALDGVAGTAAAIRLDFLDPGGSKTGRLLPTGRAVDRIELPGLGAVEVSLVDAANPVMFVAASAQGLTGTEMPEALGADAALMARLEALRCAGSVAMGLTPDPAVAAALLSIPKLVLLAPPADSPTLEGRRLRAEEADITARAISVGQPHKAIPLTAALCLAAAVRVPGTLAARLAAPGVSGAGEGSEGAREEGSGVGGSDTDRSGAGGSIRIAHPSGTIAVDALTEARGGEITIRHATVLRSARRLFEGQVCIPAPQPPQG